MTALNTLCLFCHLAAAVASNISRCRFDKRALIVNRHTYSQDSMSKLNYIEMEREKEKNVHVWVVADTTNTASLTTTTKSSKTIKRKMKRIFYALK